MKVGDKIICIDNERLEHNLTEGKIYIISEVLPEEYKSYSIMGNWMYGMYSMNRFISIKEYRKEKLDKINNL